MRGGGRISAFKEASYCGGEIDVILGIVIPSKRESDLAEGGHESISRPATAKWGAPPINAEKGQRPGNVVPTVGRSNERNYTEFKAKLPSVVVVVESDGQDHHHRGGILTK